MRWCKAGCAAQAPLTFKGVVFNEMKGVYSSPDSMNQRHTQQAIFPDNTYAVDSGGDPVDIPNLSFDECALTPLHNSVVYVAIARFREQADLVSGELLLMLCARLCHRRPGAAGTPPLLCCERMHLDRIVHAEE